MPQLSPLICQVFFFFRHLSSFAKKFYFLHFHKICIFLGSLGQNYQKTMLGASKSITKFSHKKTDILEMTL